MVGVKSITLTFGDGPEIKMMRDHGDEWATTIIPAVAATLAVPKRMLLGQVDDYTPEDVTEFHENIQRLQAISIQNEAAHIAAVARETGSTMYANDLQELAADLYRYARELMGVSDE